MITVAKTLKRDEWGRKIPVRASLVTCDFPLCNTALEVRVNLQSSTSQCKADTYRYLRKERPHGWATDGRRETWCGRHAPMRGHPLP